MLEHLMKDREAGPSGERSNAHRNEDNTERNNGLEVGLPLSQGINMAQNRLVVLSC